MGPIIARMTRDAPAPAPTRIGFTPDELAAAWGTNRTQRYAACVPGLSVLAGETVALVGDGTGRLRDRLAAELDDCVTLDGAVAAAGGTVRIHAVQAARVGVKALAISDPFGATGAATRDLAVADLAGLADLGLTTVVSVADVALAARFSDRVVVVRDGCPVVAYPVVAPTPRSPDEIAPVTRRVAARLAAGGARPARAVG